MLVCTFGGRPVSEPDPWNNCPHERAAREAAEEPLRCLDDVLLELADDQGGCRKDRSDVIAQELRGRRPMRKGGGGASPKETP